MLPGTEVRIGSSDQELYLLYTRTRTSSSSAVDALCARSEEVVTPPLLLEGASRSKKRSVIRVIRVQNAPGEGRARNASSIVAGTSRRHEKVYVRSI
jgi:hypothetical protein